MHNHSNGNELRILMEMKLICLRIVEHQDSLRNRDKQQLGNGPLTSLACTFYFPISDHVMFPREFSFCFFISYAYIRHYTQIIQTLRVNLRTMVCRD